VNGDHRRTVLITGGSRGIGAAAALKFAANGVNVVIQYLHSHDAAQTIAEQCRRYGVESRIYAADVRSRAQIQAMKEELFVLGLVPDVLVNNAGIAHYGMLADVSEEEWDDVIDTNLKGMFLVTQAFMEPMVRRKFGRIINVSSIWGSTGAACEVVYSAAKGGVNAFTQALAKEHAPSGVTVNAVAPGAVRTSMLDHLRPDELSALVDDIPVGRLAEPEEIASLIYFLSLPESGYITGQIISPNGGWLT